MRRFGRTRSWRKSRSRVARSTPLSRIRHRHPTPIRLCRCYDSPILVLLIWRNTVRFDVLGREPNAKTSKAKSRQRNPGDGHRGVPGSTREALGDDSRHQSAAWATRSRPAERHRRRSETRRPTEAPHDEQVCPRQDRRRAESAMGGAEAATGVTSPTGDAQEAEDVGGRFEGHQSSHEEAVGGLAESPQSCGVGPYQLAGGGRTPGGTISRRKVADIVVPAARSAVGNVPKCGDVPASWTRTGGCHRD
jgi:hypothetical protein